MIWERSIAIIFKGMTEEGGVRKERDGVRGGGERERKKDIR